jgi:hypothetical protein
MVFWGVTHGSSINTNGRFGETCCLSFHDIVVVKLEVAGFVWELCVYETVRRHVSEERTPNII